MCGQEREGLLSVAAWKMLQDVCFGQCESEGNVPPFELEMGGMTLLLRVGVGESLYKGKQSQKLSLVHWGVGPGETLGRSKKECSLNAMPELFIFPLVGCILYVSK